MLPDRVSNPGPLTYESGALPIALRGPAHTKRQNAVLALNIRKQTILILLNTSDIAFYIKGGKFEGGGCIKSTIAKYL